MAIGGSKEYKMKNKILVLGAGAWGTAIANLLAKNHDEQISIWAYERNVVSEINEKKKNTLFLPRIKLNNSITAITTFKKNEAKYIFVAVPSQHVRSLLENYFKALPKFKAIKTNVILCSKGFDLKRKKLLSEVIENICPKKNILIMSGPSFADLVAKDKPTAVTLAYGNLKIAKEVRTLLTNNNFRVYLNNDKIGVQIFGATKNILAIASGITDGLGYGENARAAIISRGIKEIEKISLAMGGKKNSTLGLSGIGDILLTCTSITSRNYSFGKLIGKGYSTKEILKNKLTVTEGVENCKALQAIKMKHALETPILDAVHKVLVENYPIKKIVNTLLSRSLKSE